MLKKDFLAGLSWKTQSEQLDGKNPKLKGPGKNVQQGILQSFSTGSICHKKNENWYLVQKNELIQKLSKELLNNLKAMFSSLNSC